jgi:hypothetical protein
VYINTVEFHLSGLIVTESHPHMQKIHTIGVFFENRLHWKFEARLLLFAVCKSKVKQSRYRPEQTQRVVRGIALSFLDPGARRWSVVSTTPRPLYPRERPGTHCTGGWVGLRAGLDLSEKPRPHQDSTPEQSSP